MTVVALLLDLDLILHQLHFSISKLILIIDYNISYLDAKINLLISAQLMLGLTTECFLTKPKLVVKWDC